MAMYKNSDSNLNQIVEIIYTKKCEKCGFELNLLKSNNGEIVCDKCQFVNKISEK